jgi:shikimate dehydrogenase
VGITAHTKVVALFGYPVAHSLSPIMHNAAFAALGLDYCYVACPVRPEALGDALRAVKALGLRGCNITVPHKEKAVAMIDEMTDAVRDIGAVNTVLNDDGRLIGHNTDARGFVESLREGQIGLCDKRVLLIGAGGAARAVAYALSQEVSYLSIYNRTRERAEALAQSLRGRRAQIEVADEDAVNRRDALSRIDVVINATSLGLREDDPLPLRPSLLSERHAVCDLIYHQTPLLGAASRLGCRTLDGSGMLLWQGAFAFEIWTGVKAPVAQMREALMGGRETKIT